MTGHDGHDANQRLVAPTDNPKIGEILSNLGISESPESGIKIHYVDTKVNMI